MAAAAATIPCYDPTEMQHIQSVVPDLYDFEDMTGWNTALKSQGYVVIKNFLPGEKRVALIKLFWEEFMLACSQSKDSRLRSIDRRNKQTWVQPRPHHLSPSRPLTLTPLPSRLLTLTLTLLSSHPSPSSLSLHPLPPPLTLHTSHFTLHPHSSLSAFTLSSHPSPSPSTLHPRPPTFTLQPHKVGAA